MLKNERKSGVNVIGYFATRKNNHIDQPGPDVIFFGAQNDFMRYSVSSNTITVWEPFDETKLMLEPVKLTRYPLRDFIPLSV
jgi:hypothetical protein